MGTGKTFMLAAAWAAANAIAYIAFGTDKQAAEQGARRIPESTLMLISALGVFGALAGMRRFRHKTRKPKFRYGVPLILAVEAAAAIMLLLP